MDKDCMSAVVDEVALEGLDGITIETFWLRLKTTKNFPLAVDDKSKTFLWRCLVSVKDFKFYELKEERNNPVVYNKEDCVDPHTGYLVEYDLGTESDIYPIEIISDDNIQGSCSTYKTRKDVTDDVRDKRYQPRLSLQEVMDKYGNRLVVVASQEQRSMALMGPEFDPTFVLPDMNYCILERIGRQRYDGELSGGSLSLDSFKLPPKTLFYYTKLLSNYGLITKQHVAISKSLSSQAKRSLFHVKRFYRKFSSKYNVLSELVSRFLSTCPNNRYELAKARQKLKIDQKSFKKLYQQDKKHFHVYVVNYREMYPDAPQEEYFSLKSMEEKQIRVIEFISNASDDEDDEEEEEAENQDHEEELPLYEYTYERSQLRQYMSALNMAGAEGVSQQSLGRSLNLEFFLARGVFRAFEERKDLASAFVKERGKQKVKRFVSRKLLDQSKTLTEFSTEMQKLKKYMKRKKDVPVVLDKSETGAEESTVSSEVAMDTTDVNQSQASILNETMETDQIDEEDSDDEEIDISQLGHKIFTDIHIKRMNWILDVVREKKIIDNLVSLAKIIIEKEKVDGNKHKMHKKSLNRLLDILVKKEKIRMITKEIKAKDKAKVVTLLMDISVQPDDPKVTSFFHQAQLKLMSAKKEQLTEVNQKKHREKERVQKLMVPENIPDSAKDSINRIHNLRSILKHTDMIHDPRAFRMYGYRPKYQRAQTIHHVLFYLLYDYRGKIHADRGSGSRPQIPVIDSQNKTGNQSENESHKADVPVQGEEESTKTDCPEQSTSEDQGKTFQLGSNGCDNEKAATEGQSQSEGPDVGNNEGQGQNEGGGKIEGQTKYEGQTQNEGHSLNEGQGQNEGRDLNEGQGQNKGQGQNEIQTQNEDGGQNEDQDQNVSQSKLEGEVKNKGQSHNEDQGSMETSKTIDQIQSLCDEEGSNTNNQGTVDQQQATEQNITGEDQKNKEGGTNQETDNAPSKGSPEMMEESVSLKIAKLIEDMPEPPVYLNEYTWRRYLPPLPKHSGFPEGWVLVSDILLHLPVSIFCSLNMIAYRIPGLRELLNDPIKSLYPVICLPKELTHYLLYARKYIYSFHENCINLCNMGLISFGPQLLKEKDKVFIYLRKMTSLLDTRKSPQGCCVTKLSSRAERLYYMFKTEDDLENYWTDLRQFAFNSNLGFRNCEDPLLDDSDILVSLKQAQKNKALEEIEDNGHVPGNGRGAAGFDSSLFVHIYRNWNSISNQNNKMTKYNVRRKEKLAQAKKGESNEIILKTDLQELKGNKSLVRMPRIKLKSRFTLANDEDKATEVIKVIQTEGNGNKGGKGIKRKAEALATEPKKRKLHSRFTKEQTRERKRLKDATDVKAFSKKLSQRVKWTPNQDTVLLICKIASLVMDRKRRGILVNWALVRDFLHKHAPVESRDKTSAACQRRVMHSLKSEATKINLNIFLAEAMQDPVVIPFSQKLYIANAKETEEVFGKLATYLMQKFKKGVLTKPVLPERLNDWKNFTVSTLNQNYKKIAPYQEVRNLTHIMGAMLRNIFHSYVSCNDKYGRAYSMFKLLNQYPEALLDNVLRQMRTDCLITRLKSEKTKFNTQSPAEAGLRVKLSQVYIYRLHSRVPRALFDVTAKTMKDIEKACDDEECGFFFHATNFREAGICASMISLMYHQQLQCRIFMPVDIVRMDPSRKKQGRGQYLSDTKAMQRAEEDSEDEDTEAIQMDLAGEEDSTASQGSSSQDGKDSQLSAGQSSLWLKESVRRGGKKDDATSQIAYHIGQNASVYFPELEEEENVDNKKHRDGSRALITMRRSKAESSSKPYIISIVDNFVINPPELHVSVGNKTLHVDGSNRKTNMDVDNLQHSVAHEEEEGTGKTQHSETTIDTPYKQKFGNYFVNMKIIRDIVQQQTKVLPAQIDLKSVWEKLEFSKKSSIIQTYKMIESAKDLGIKETKLLNQHRDVGVCNRNVQILLSHDVKQNSILNNMEKHKDRSRQTKASNRDLPRAFKEALYSFPDWLRPLMVLVVFG